MHGILTPRHSSQTTPLDLHGCVQPVVYQHPWLCHSVAASCSWVGLSACFRPVVKSRSFVWPQDGRLCPQYRRKPFFVQASVPSCDVHPPRLSMLQAKPELWPGLVENGESWDFFFSVQQNDCIASQLPACLEHSMVLLCWSTAQLRSCGTEWGMSATWCAVLQPCWSWGRRMWIYGKTQRRGFM